MENNYSNIIAPSDGVRRFLCKTSVLMAGILCAAYCFCAFRMTLIEAGALGGTLRTNVLFGAYILLPVSFIASAVFARIKSVGLAYSMICLLAATLSSFMLLLNSFASLLREERLLGISGSLLEFLTFGAFFAFFVNLVISCMDFKLQPLIGLIGALAAGLALTVTSVRTLLSFTALDFAWKPEFEWGSHLRELVDTDKLRFHASWIFRSVLRGDAKALHAMFVWRFYERIGACILYAVLLMVFLKYRKEMTAFNKLLAHASEYVDIPTARIYRTIFGSGAQSDVDSPEDRVPPEQIEIRPRKTSNSLKGRLVNLTNMTRAKERGMDITEMADAYDAQRAKDFSDLNPTEEEDPSDADNHLPENRRRGQRRRPGDFGDERAERRRRPGDFGDERAERRRREDNFGDERAERRRRQDDFGDERAERRRRPDDFGDERAERRRRPDDFGDERTEHRRRQDNFGDERAERRRREDNFGERQPERRRREDNFGDERTERRRREDNFGDERAERRRREDDFGDERAERRRRPDDFGDERTERRRREDNFGDERAERRRRPDDFGDERAERRRREDNFGDERTERRRREDDFGDEREERRRRPDDFGDERAERRRREANFGDRRPGQSEPERELTDQELYLLEERRKRQRKR